MVPGLQVEAGLEEDPGLEDDPGFEDAFEVVSEPGGFVEVEPPGGVCVASQLQMALAASIMPPTLSKPHALTTQPAAAP